MDFYKRLFLPSDPRSRHGTFSRGKPVYGGGTYRPNAGPNGPRKLTIQRAAQRRLKAKNGHN